MSDVLKKLAATAAKNAEATIEVKPSIHKPGFGKAKGREVLKVEITDEEELELQAKARAQVEAKYKKIAKEKRLAELVKLYEQEAIPEQQLHPLLINVAGHANKIALDGRTYYHGQIYNVTQSEYDTLEEIMANTWRHEREVGGANFNAYRKPANALLSPGDELRPLQSLVHA